MQPWELIWPKPHFLFNCRSQGHFPIWILQLLLHILMSYTFYQTMTIIFRARKLLHSVRESQEITEILGGKIQTLYLLCATSPVPRSHMQYLSTEQGPLSPKYLP